MNKNGNMNKTKIGNMKCRGNGNRGRMGERNNHDDGQHG